MLHILVKVGYVVIESYSMSICIICNDKPTNRLVTVHSHVRYMCAMTNRLATGCTQTCTMTSTFATDWSRAYTMDNQLVTGMYN